MELPSVIQLMPMVEVNNTLPILHLSKRMVHIYTTEKTIHQFSIGYMMNHSININRVFREQVQKCLGCYFYTKTMKNIRDYLLKKNKYVMELKTIYENSGKDIITVYRVLGCVVYTLIEKYVCIDYLSCQSKTLCGISSNPTFKEKSFNLLLGIGIPELLLNLVSCHGFMTKSNSTVVVFIKWGF